MALRYAGRQVGTAGVVGMGMRGIGLARLLLRWAGRGTSGGGKEVERRAARSVWRGPGHHAGPSTCHVVLRWAGGTWGGRGGGHGVDDTGLGRMLWR